MRHWEATGVATAGGVSAGTAAGGSVWAISALVAAGVTLALVAFPSPQWNRARSRRLPLLLALVGMMGSLGALVAGRGARGALGAGGGCPPRGPVCPPGGGDPARRPGAWRGAVRRHRTPNGLGRTTSHAGHPSPCRAGRGHHPLFR